MFAWQLFRGQYHLLRAGICHRDIKPQNLLIDEESGLLKIGDFGSSAIEPRKSPQPSYHVTRYYRPPELLLGAKMYGCEVGEHFASNKFWKICGAGICHRDIKPQNLLIDEESGLLKIGDFGSSAIEPRKSPQPSYHVTRYYRPPELLLGAKMYGCEVVIVVIRFKLYIDCFGFPTDHDVAAMNASKHKWKELKSVLPITTDCPPDAVKLLTQMLVYMPTQRLHGPQLLCDPFFKELFDKNTKRPSGKPIGCLSKADVNDVIHGDSSMTASIQ
ncbi:unnamed protein product [Strongylus vulgaris]|uniref:Protein kinase domain-containing protein n=1 Tax=Strongylus vulgaris TaxID=40348 RepID=A0A3P7JAV2_STRVU|nr:unnamed protein product [Strongylus vulgaris]